MWAVFNLVTVGIVRIVPTQRCRAGRRDCCLHSLGLTAGRNHINSQIVKGKIIIHAPQCQPSSCIRIAVKISHKRFPCTGGRNRYRVDGDERCIIIVINHPQRQTADTAAQQITLNHQLRHRMVHNRRTYYHIPPLHIDKMIRNIHVVKQKSRCTCSSWDRPAIQAIILKILEIRKRNRVGTRGGKFRLYESLPVTRWTDYKLILTSWQQTAQRVYRIGIIHRKRKLHAVPPGFIKTIRNVPRHIVHVGEPFDSQTGVCHICAEHRRQWTRVRQLRCRQRQNLPLSRTVGSERARNRHRQTVHRVCCQLA